MMISGDKTLYFSLLDSDSRNPSAMFRHEIGPMEGPLPKELWDTQKNVSYTSQSYIYRLSKDGHPVLLWSYKVGFIKPEYDPEYMEYIKLRKKFGDTA